MKFLFFTFNALAILSMCVDFAYYKFTFKHTTADVFFLFSSQNNIIGLIPLFLKDYWYIIILWLALVILTWKLYEKTKVESWKLETNQQQSQYSILNSQFYKYFKYFTFQSLLFVFFIGLGIIGSRGGLQLKPISIINAGEYTEAKNIPLVVNTPFTILKTIEGEDLKEMNYFKEGELRQIFDPMKERQKAKGVRHKAQDELRLMPYDLRLTPNRDSLLMPYDLRLTPNIVVIILESFSKEFVGKLNSNEGYTPFLDSLITQSLVFDNAYANGKKSMEGIPAILASVPSIMNNAYISSKYAANEINSLASILKKKGYATSFYHGGTNGTMGFDAFAGIAGFDNYYGRNEYNNEKDFDGNWGIWDEEFFQYFAKAMDTEKQPFFSTVFSLTSHHPYPIPEKYKNQFKEGPSPILKCVRYTDYALRKFFESASKTSWFDNTLFVITADHSADPMGAFYYGKVGLYAIPIIFYKPDNSLKGINHQVIQQSDIMPTVLDYLNYDKDYFAFGQSAFNVNSEHFAVNYLDQVYQLINDDYSLQFDGEKSIALYHYKTDSTLQNNLLDSSRYKEIKQKMENKIKAVVQTYNHSLINNEMIIK